jgi:hypothetical protein
MKRNYLPQFLRCPLISFGIFLSLMPETYSQGTLKIFPGADEKTHPDLNIFHGSTTLVKALQNNKL